jgi:hypothetical protein
MEYFKQPNKKFFNKKEEVEKTPIRLVRNRGSPIRASNIDDVVPGHYSTLPSRARFS